MPRAGQEILTLPEHTISDLALPGVRDIRFTIDFTTVLCTDPISVYLWLYHWICIFVHGLRLLITGICSIVGIFPFSRMGSLFVHVVCWIVVDMAEHKIHVHIKWSKLLHNKRNILFQRYNSHEWLMPFWNHTSGTYALLLHDWYHLSSSSLVACIIAFYMHAPW